MFVDFLNQAYEYLIFFIWSFFGNTIENGSPELHNFGHLVVHLSVGVAVSVFIFICRKIKQLLV